MPETDDSITLKKAFKREWSLRDKFRKQFEDVVRDLLCGIDIIIIDSRTKTEDSFFAKAVRAGKNYSDPIGEITDFTGVRVVVEYKDEARRAAKLLSDNLRIDDKNSWLERSDATESDFGYSAIHLIACITEELADKHSCQVILDKKFEIQIRTNLEHAWATKSRHLLYDKDVPREYRRAFNRLAALLEIAEESFATLRDKIQTIPRVSATCSKSNLTISADDVIQLLTTRPPIATVVRLLADSGLKVSDSSRKDYAQAIADVLMRQGARSKEEAEEMIGNNAPAVATACKMYMEATKMSSFPKDSLIVAALAIVNNGPIAPEEYSSGWGERWKNGFLKASLDFKQWREANPT